MNKRIFMMVTALMVGLFLLSGPGWAVETAETDETGDIIYPGKTTVKPRIDGILDEEPWQVPPLNEDFISYDPLYGEKLPYKTLVWMTYDNKNLYFAFMCYDSEPQKIKTSLTSRDNMWGDDWMGIMLDSLGNKQTMYGFGVNPNGIQGDLLQSSTAQDVSPDFVWESAGKITSNGYRLEICIPLRSIRFNSGKEVKMGIMFKRKITRLSVRGSWPELKPGEGDFNLLMPVVYRGLKKPLKLEILPTITRTSNRQRLQPDQWNKSENITGFGIGLKYGITSSITADITINPDFSQVESDAFQVEVNQRYPLFYNEKRPFFMEGADIFNFFTTPNGFLPYAVHTRRIIDPVYGVKLTGTMKNVSFGILNAGDKWPGQVEDGINPHKDKIAFFGIARGKYSLGMDNYIGILYSGREFVEEYNRVIGADIGFRLSKNQKISASFLQSYSSGENGFSTNNNRNISHSRNFNFLYAYSTKPLEINAAFEHIGREFRMDSAYLRRTGLDEGWASIAYNFYHDSQKIPWLKLIKSSIFFQYLHDLNTNMEDMNLNLGLIFNFIKEGHILINYYAIKESWEGQAFDLNKFYLHGGMLFTKWLQMCAEVTWGEKIYYQTQPAYKGKGYDLWLTLDLQPNNNLKQTFNFYHSDLFKNKKKIYDVNIFFSSTTYQFNKYFFLRAVLQYNSYDKRMLTDFLASFTFIPGTVFHLGYGGLYESRKWQNNNWLYRQGDLLNVRRSFFLKASYLWRF